MQSYKTIKGQDNVKDTRNTINDSMNTIMSNHSGTAFPTENLQVGMKCYRTDLGKTYTLTDADSSIWKEDNHATVADSTNKLSGLELVSDSSKGDTYGKIPKVGTDGVLEIGKYIDFHSKSKDNKDYSTRITANDDGSLTVSGRINASINGNAATATNVTWTGVTGKPSTYTPSSHNHDTAYPSVDGSRAKGTWGISVTGSAGSVAWNSVTGKPSTYMPATHNHDSSYPSQTGARASGTWNINITGKANTATKADTATLATTATKAVDSDTLNGYHYADIVSEVKEIIPEGIKTTEPKVYVYFTSSKTQSAGASTYNYKYYYSFTLTEIVQYDLIFPSGTKFTKSESLLKVVGDLPRLPTSGGLSDDYLWENCKDYIYSEVKDKLVGYSGDVDTFIVGKP